MHDVGLALDGVKLLHPDRAEAADLAEVVAAQIHQHIVLGQFLFVGQQLRFQRLVLRLCPTPWPGPGQRKGVQHAVFQLQQRFGGGAGHLRVGP